MQSMSVWGPVACLRAVDRRMEGVGHLPGGGVSVPENQGDGLSGISLGVGMKRESGAFLCWGGLHLYRRGVAITSVPRSPRVALRIRGTLPGGGSECAGRAVGPRVAVL